MTRPSFSQVEPAFSEPRSSAEFWISPPQNVYISSVEVVTSKEHDHLLDKQVTDKSAVEKEVQKKNGSLCYHLRLSTICFNTRVLPF